VNVVGGAVVSVTLLVVVTTRLESQDTVSAPVRHLLPVDLSRVQPFRRTYDMIVHTADSSIVLGQREVRLDSAAYAGAPAWLLVETRTGVVPAVESLYVAPDMRPLHWSSTLGSARLGAEFVGDSIYGATTAPSGKQNIVLGSRPDLFVSAAMAETLLPLLPLTSTWMDSVGLLAADLVATTVLPAEIVVVGEEDLALDTLSQRASWVVAIRTASRSVIYWIDKENGATLRMEQALPLHIGRLLQYRLRADPPPAPPPPPPFQSRTAPQQRDESAR
jgi:hypothetical protein